MLKLGGKIKTALFTALLLGGAVASEDARASDTLFQQYVGNYGVSTSGWGSVTLSSGTISTTAIPVGSTVTAAYLYSSTYGGTVAGGTFGGNAVSYVGLGVNPTACCSLQAYRADVTSTVAAAVNGGPGGVYNFNVTETNTGGQDGEALVVVYSNPLNATQTVAILNGFASSTGDTATLNFASALHPAAPGFFVHMALGDGFSCCNQASTVTVNGTTITNQAGNNDSSVDASLSNGNLITVGNINGNFSPLLPSYANDHESYSLANYITDGDTSINVKTANSSQDDNIFLIVFNSVGEATVITNGVPEPSTWAMMILGFAGIGFMAYRRRNQGVRFV